LRLSNPRHRELGGNRRGNARDASSPQGGRDCPRRFVSRMAPSGRDTRDALPQVAAIAHMKSNGGVVFEPMGTYVDRWRATSPLRDWLATRPVHARDGAR
jgi:hypothetical protein